MERQRHLQRTQIFILPLSQNFPSTYRPIRGPRNSNPAPGHTFCEHKCFSEDLNHDTSATRTMFAAPIPETTETNDFRLDDIRDVHPFFFTSIDATPNLRIGILVVFTEDVDAQSATLGRRSTPRPHPPNPLDILRACSGTFLRLQFGMPVDPVHNRGAVVPDFHPPRAPQEQAGRSLLVSSSARLSFFSVLYSVACLIDASKLIVTSSLRSGPCATNFIQ